MNGPENEPHFIDPIRSGWPQGIIEQINLIAGFQHLEKAIREASESSGRLAMALNWATLAGAFVGFAGVLTALYVGTIQKMTSTPAFEWWWSTVAAGIILVPAVVIGEVLRRKWRRIDAPLSPPK